jgi:hypothetical protein
VSLYSWLNADSEDAELQMLKRENRHLMGEFDYYEPGNVAHRLAYQKAVQACNDKRVELEGG